MESFWRSFFSPPRNKIRNPPSEPISTSLFHLETAACLADEELKLEEDTIEEHRRKAEDESRRSQLVVQQQEDFKRKKEEKM